MVCLQFFEPFLNLTDKVIIYCFKMSQGKKKITFSFTKVRKPALIRNLNANSKEKIDYVDCFDGSKGEFSYKGNIKSDKSVKQELVIPMPSSKTSSDIVKLKIEEKESKILEKGGTNEVGEKNIEDSKTKQHFSKNLEELATLEILKDINHDQTSNNTGSALIIEAKNLPPQANENDIDYDNIPVTEFGMALLRGMGWRPDQGIGKDPRIIKPPSPNLRPKGLGLGAKLNTEITDDEKNKKKNNDERNSKKNNDEKYTKRNSDEKYSNKYNDEKYVKRDYDEEF